MTDERDEVRARTDIVSLVGASVRLERAGKTWKGLCPFHSDKNPSFTVNPDTGRYRCWACGEAGDVFTWVMKTQNVEFPEALRILAKQAGVEIADRQNRASSSEREAQAAAMAEAAKFFQDHLQKSELALRYCAARGIDEATRSRWGIGYAPDVGEALVAHLKRKGFSLAECKSLFLVDQDARGGFYDKFRGRLMFPIWTERGDLVAFGGRILGQGQPKYINSSDTPLYRKSRVLYGMNKAREALQSTKTAVLVEGYLDVIACHTAGVESAVASLGTSLAEDHVKLLRRWVEEVVILYDSDAAGQKAAERATALLLAEGLKVKVALMPPGEDPDTLLRSVGPSAVREAVEGGISPLDYRFETLARKLSPSDEAYWTEAVQILADAPNEMELQKHLVRLSTQYPGLRGGIQTQQALRRQVAETKRQRKLLQSDRARGAVRRAGPIAAPAYGVSRSHNLNSDEVVVLGAFMSEDFRTHGWTFGSRSELFETPDAVAVSDAIRAAFPAEAPRGTPSTWLHLIQPESHATLLDELLHDFQATRISEATIFDAVERLNKRRTQRAVDSGLMRELSKEERLALTEKLKALKPDKNARPPSDSLF